MSHVHGNRTVAKPLFRILSLMFVFIALLNAATPSISAQAEQTVNYHVVVKENASDPLKTDVYLSDPATGAETFLMTLADIYRNHYHNAEYHNGNLYIIHRTGGELGYEIFPDTWTDELWRYSPEAPAVKLFADRGLDFRVSDDEQFIAVRGSADTGEDELTLMDTSGTVLQSYLASDLDPGMDLTPIKWGNSAFWLYTGIAAGINTLVKIDTADLQPTVFNVTGLPLSSRDFDINPANDTIAFSDYPLMFDTDSHDAFVESGATVTLYVHDLNERTQEVVATSIVKDFRPRWLDATTLEYNDPDSDGRITSQIP